jgi:hypothetical protein
MIREIFNHHLACSWQRLLNYGLLRLCDWLLLTSSFKFISIISISILLGFSLGKVYNAMIPAYDSLNIMDLSFIFE